MSDADGRGPVDRDVGPETETEALKRELMEAHQRAASTWDQTVKVLTAQAAELDRLRAERDALRAFANLVEHETSEDSDGLMPHEPRDALLILRTAAIKVLTPNYK